MVVPTCTTAMGVFEAEIDITPAAQAKIYALLQQEEDALCFRAQIVGGGCQGLSYSFALDLKEDDDYFKFFNGDHPVSIVVDALSHPYVAGARIDYVLSAQGEHFTVDNPNATGECSCGSSFSRES